METINDKYSDEAKKQWEYRPWIKVYPRKESDPENSYRMDAVEGETLEEYALQHIPWVYDNYMLTWGRLKFESKIGEKLRTITYELMEREITFGADLSSNLNKYLDFIFPEPNHDTLLKVFQTLKRPI